MLDEYTLFYGIEEITVSTIRSMMQIERSFASKAYDLWGLAGTYFPHAPKVASTSTNCPQLISDGLMRV